MPESTMTLARFGCRDARVREEAPEHGVALGGIGQLPRRARARGGAAAVPVAALLAAPAGPRDPCPRSAGVVRRRRRPPRRSRRSWPSRYAHLGSYAALGRGTRQGSALALSGALCATGRCWVKPRHPKGTAPHGSARLIHFLRRLSSRGTMTPLGVQLKLHGAPSSTGRSCCQP